MSGLKLLSAVLRMDAKAFLGVGMVEGEPKAMLAGPNGDNPLILGPAGTMHMSGSRFCKMGRLACRRGQASPRPGFDHTGSNTMNLALAMFWPEKDFGFVIMTIIAGTAADEALRKLAAELYKAFFQ